MQGIRGGLCLSFVQHFMCRDCVADGQTSSKDEGGISDSGSCGSITTGRVRFLLLYPLFREFETARLERCSLERSFAGYKKAKMSVEHSSETSDAGETAQSTC